MKSHKHHIRLSNVMKIYVRVVYHNHIHFIYGIYGIYGYLFFIFTSQAINPIFVLIDGKAEEKNCSKLHFFFFLLILCLFTLCGAGSLLWLLSDMHVLLLLTIWIYFELIVSLIMLRRKKAGSKPAFFKT